MLGGRLLFDFNASFDLVTYATGRTDSVVGLDLGLRGRVTEWLELGGGYRLDIRVAGDTTSSYQRHVVGGLIKVRY